jgi:hypothetical protein
LNVSAMKRLPSLSTTTPLGSFNSALVAGPVLLLAQPRMPLPATVVISPEGVTSRTTSLSVSAMNRLPVESIATAPGHCSSAPRAPASSPP